MASRAILSCVMILTAVGIVVSGCGSGVKTDLAVPNSTTPASPSIAGEFTKPDQVPSTVVLHARTVSGLAVPNVLVYLSLIEPCDPVRQNVPGGESTQSLGLDATTDANGAARYLAVTGCYRFGVKTPPSGKRTESPEPGTLFVTVPGQTVEGSLIFADQ
ncbi:hypothetical protein GFY24_20005 [Nocardia sp. SYP-A9097]|uniref:hypothetical protein n=1 Tax=Nocardia sp. SYP-A9097 TaxID=2663237 RepID=UPI00129BBF48|nr:hypothetical protein [Nocardia sp. SYP-A9097]MRH89701.1 hypothetical protein [Nocardia sp. SYP-A9097]